ncbi:hypothetical protein H5410_009998 [Solanum commersonii]|uniref:Uncharacterized protein n=1 Tax=Solanum commersonii TaxID=4109 RepID=A0A9J6AKC2_SOLCO|nr:hypothetical protein H5410_009998 [Solanum commersonii]
MASQNEKDLVDVLFGVVTNVTARLDIQANVVERISSSSPYHRRSESVKKMSIYDDARGVDTNGLNACLDFFRDLEGDVIEIPDEVSLSSIDELVDFSWDLDILNDMLGVHSVKDELKVTIGRFRMEDREAQIFFKVGTTFYVKDSGAGGGILGGAVGGEEHFRHSMVYELGGKVEEDEGVSDLGPADERVSNLGPLKLVKGFLQVVLYIPTGLKFQMLETFRLFVIKQRMVVFIELGIVLVANTFLQKLDVFPPISFQYFWYRSGCKPSRPGALLRISVVGLKEIDKMREDVGGEVGLISYGVSRVIFRVEDFVPSPSIDGGSMEETGGGISLIDPVNPRFCSLEFFFHFEEGIIVF